MKESGEVEPELPYTPTESGREAKLREFGLEGGFKVWVPVLMAGALSLMIAVFWLGGRGGPVWQIKLAIATLPFLAVLAFVKLFIEGKPPHYLEDMWETGRNLRVDWEDPPIRWLPIMPRIYADLSFNNRPFSDMGLEHPLAHARRKFQGQQNSERDED